MAYYSIEKRQRAEGTTRYRCTVGVRKNGEYLYRESKTFTKQNQATSWGVRLVSELETHGVPSESSVGDLTIGDLIDKYITHPIISANLGRSIKGVLNLLLRNELAKILLSSIQPHSFIEHCRYRASIGASPSTVSQDVTYLSSVLTSPKPLFNIDVNQEALNVARSTVTKMGVISQSKRRSRRPSREEIDRLMQGLAARIEASAKSTPFADIFLFSILSCMRVGGLLFTLVM